MKTYFQAIFYLDEDKTWINVKLVDILFEDTCAKSYEDAVYMAKDCFISMLGSKNVLYKVTPYETVKRLCGDNKWIELIEIDLPEETIQLEGIFINNIDDYFPSLESKLLNDRIKKDNLSKLVKG